MIVNIIESIERADDEILRFFFEQVIVGNDIDSVKKYFNVGDYVRVEEFWNEALQMELDMIEDMKNLKYIKQEDENICRFN